LALLDTSARPDTPAQTALRRQRIAKTKSGRFIEMVAEAFPNSVHPSRHQDEALRAINRAMAEDIGPEAYLRQQAAIMARIDSRPTLAAIHCPTLVVVGDSDALTPPEQAAEMAQGIAGARLVTIAECGHVSTLERPQPVTVALVEWLEG
jgi:pimeloyl-ACP methyl ester carboxylesterase